MGYGFHRVRRGGIALFQLLLSLPALQGLGTVGSLGGAEHVGVAEHQLLGDAVHHVVWGEAAPLLLHDSVKHHLE